MDIYCSTCAEPYELYIGDDEDRAVIDSVRRGECPSCKGVKPVTCHDCGGHVTGEDQKQRGCGSNDACDNKVICIRCWEAHEYDDNHTRKHETNKLTRADASAVLYDILGADLDGVASMMDDAEYMGMFD